MASTNWYVDPDAGDDGTGDGTSEGTAWATLGYALANYTATANQGDIINIKNSATMTLTANILSFSHSGPTPSNTQPLLIRGYSSTIGDGGQAEIAGNYTINDTQQNPVHWQDIYFNGVNRIRSGNYGTFVGCKFESLRESFYLQWGKAINCEFAGSTVGSYIRPSGAYHIIGCHFNTLNGSSPTYFINCAGAACLIANNIFNVDGQTVAITNSSTTGFARNIINNTFYAQSTGTYIYGHGTAISINSNVYGMVIINNIFEGWLGAVDISDNLNRPGVYINNNHFYDNDNDLDVSNDFQSQLDNTTAAGSSVLTKSGSNTHANRHTFFAPTGVAESGGDSNGSLVYLGAIPPASGGGGGGGGSIIRVPGMGGGFNT